MASVRQTELLALIRATGGHGLDGADLYRRYGDRRKFRSALRALDSEVPAMTRLTPTQLAALEVCQRSGVPDRRGCISPRTLRVLLRLGLVYRGFNRWGGGKMSVSVWASTKLGDKVLKEGGRLPS